MKKAQSHMVNNQQRGQSDRTPTAQIKSKQEASQQYAEYLQRMQKEIHDEKMKRFVEHTQKLNEAIPEKSPDRRQRSISKRVDTGLRKENQQVDLEYRVSISPERKRSTSKGFQVKPTEINHFTGRRKTLEDKRHVDLEIQRDSDVSGNMKRDDELFVQVGEHTQVFKYGERPDE